MKFIMFLFIYLFIILSFGDQIIGCMDRTAHKWIPSMKQTNSERIYANEGYLLPQEEFKRQYKVPVQDSIEPNVTMEEVMECVKYLKLTKFLAWGKRTATCSGDTAYLLFEGSKRDAKTIYDRWMMGIKREKYDLKKDDRKLSVFVLPAGGVEATSHYCTDFGSH